MCMSEMEDEEEYVAQEQGPVTMTIQDIVTSVTQAMNVQQSEHTKINEIAPLIPKPARARGSCFTCGSMEHLNKSCPKRKMTTEAPDSTSHLLEPLVEVVPSYRVEAKLDIKNKYISISPILDTGSPISLIKENLVQNETLQPCDYSSYEGINQSKLKILGILNTDIIIDEVKFKISLHVVTNDTMRFDCLLGRNFIANPGIKLTFSDCLKIEIIKSDETNENDIFMIDLDVDENSQLNNLNINSEIDMCCRDKLVKCIADNYFNVTLPDKPKTDFCMKIIVNPDHTPFFFRPRRLSYCERTKVNNTLDKLLEDKIIQKSTSEYSSPIVVVNKPDGEIRLCVDYRELNKTTVRDNFPCPNIDEQIEKLKNKKYFSRLDLKDAFHHVKVDKDSVKYTAFVTPRGQFEYLRMPFGLKNSPAIFSRYINTIFKDMIDDDQLTIYVDDILVATETIEENVIILEKVFKLLTDNLLTLRIDKCSFLNTKIDFLGYTISHNTIRPNPRNIKAVSEFPTPRNFKEIQQFLGLTSYFRRFIKNYAVIAKPLYDLLKKNVEFTFSEPELQAFELLKALLIKEPVLAIFNAEAETQLHCDASKDGYGAILLQRQKDGKFHPVFYFSKKTSETESKYHSYELEMLAIVYSLERFRIYLTGMPNFKIITDCNAIKQALAKKDINPRILRWSLILHNYNYTIDHRPNKSMAHADALSRNSILVITENTLERNLSIKQNQDKKITDIRDCLETSENKFFELRDGLVYRKHEDKLLFVVPECMQDSVIRTYHDDVGHTGVDKTQELISRTYWFPNLKKKVKSYIQNCLKCITYSPVTGKPEGYLHPIPKGNKPFETIHLDHYGPLEKTSHDKKHLFVVIDGFTKFVKLYPCKSTGTKEVMKHLDMYFHSYSRPARVISDRGSAFTAKDMKDYFEEKNIQHVLIATGTPRANGQVEVVNRSITPMLAKLSPETDRWDEVIFDVEYALNNTVNRSTGESPK